MELAGAQSPSPVAPLARETPEKPIPVALGLEVVRWERNSRRAAAFPSSLCMCVCIYINTQGKKKSQTLIKIPFFIHLPIFPLSPSPILSKLIINRSRQK